MSRGSYFPQVKIKSLNKNHNINGGKRKLKAKKYEFTSWKTKF